MEFARSDKQIKLVICLYEAIGTAFLLLGVNCSSSTTDPYAMPMIASIMYFAAYVTLSPVSGGHFNPAVTLGVVVREGRKHLKSNLIFSSLIMASQCFGGIFGVFVSMIMKKETNA